MVQFSRTFIRGKMLEAVGSFEIEVLFFSLLVVGGNKRCQLVADLLFDAMLLLKADCRRTIRYVAAVSPISRLIRTATRLHDSQ